MHAEGAAPDYSWDGERAGGRRVWAINNDISWRDAVVVALHTDTAPAVVVAAAAADNNSVNDVLMTDATGDGVAITRNYTIIARLRSSNHLTHCSLRIPDKKPRKMPPPDKRPPGHKATLTNAISWVSLLTTRPRKHVCIRFDINMFMSNYNRCNMVFCFK